MSVNQSLEYSSESDVQRKTPGDALTQTRVDPVAGDKSNASPRSLWFTPALVAFAIGALFLALFAASRFSSAGHEAINTITLTEFAGPPVFLFNGTSVDPTQPFSGKWSIEQGAEQGNVLAGDGSRTFKCKTTAGQAMKFFSFRIGFLHHHADVVEMQLETDLDGQLAKIVIDSEAATMFTGDGESITAQPVPLPKFDGDSQGYYGVQVERHVNYCEAFIEGQSLGKITTQDVSPAQVQVSVTGSGKAHFEGIQVSEFEAPDAATK